MIDKLIKIHPMFTCADELADICNPLNLLGINYFGHVNIDAKKQFTGLNNNPQFAEHYMKNHYYKADIHMAGEALGNYVMWDFIELDGASQQMDSEGKQFGINHTFTMIEKNNDGSTDYYHFANKGSSLSINQVYLANQDLLKAFITHFHEQIKQSKLLSKAYDLKVSSTENLSSYSIENKLITPDLKNDFFGNLSLNKVSGEHSFLWNAQISKLLNLREQECLYLYVLGKSPREIATIIHRSRRTVEQYMEHIKIKLNVNNKAELIEKVIYKLFINP